MSAPKSHRWSKFWWQDYERDPALRSCSLSAQGLWMRMLCFMHEGEPYGHLTVNNRAPDTKRLAAMIGKSEREVSGGVAELEEAGVFSRNEAGIIYSRRLVRDKEVSDEGREYGSRGGNPSLKPAKTPMVNGGGNQGGLTPQITEGLNLQEAEAEERKKNPPKPPLPGGAEPQAARSKTRIAKTILPSNWSPGEDERGYAISQGVDPDATALDFRDYWAGHGKPMANWSLTWQRWCRVSAARQSAGSGARKPRFSNGLLELHCRMEAGEDVVGNLLAEMEAERGTTH